MSRVGKLPIAIPDKVKVDLSGSQVTVTGPKGTLVETFNPDMTVAVEDGTITVNRPSDKPEHRALHGLTRALVNNMIVGVTEGYEKVLTIVGVGYRASMQGKALNLQLGFSHPVTVEPPEGITLTVDGNTTVKVNGIDKQQVGQVAANIRAFRKPEPYKGKGVRYENEHVRKKVGKAGAK